MSRPDPRTAAAAAPRPILIVAPLAAELAGVRARVTGLRRLQVARDQPLARRLRPYIGLLGDIQVVLAATGDGPAAAAAGLVALTAAVRPRRLLIVGVAGGLTPGLAEGTLVAARRVQPEAGAAPALQPDRPWLAQALAAGAIPGTVVSARRILTGAAAKHSAFRQIGPAGGPGDTVPPAVVVDLESAAYAHVAAARALPYLVIRAVLDAADETLPIDFEACRGAGGGVSNLRVVLRALARPATFGALWRLRGRVAAAAERLGALAERLTAALSAAMPGLARGGAAGGGRGPAQAMNMDEIHSRSSEPNLAGRRRA